MRIKQVVWIVVIILFLASGCASNIYEQDIPKIEDLPGPTNEGDESLIRHSLDNEKGGMNTDSPSGRLYPLSKLEPQADAFTNGVINQIEEPKAEPVSVQKKDQSQESLGTEKKVLKTGNPEPTKGKKEDDKSRSEEKRKEKKEEAPKQESEKAVETEVSADPPVKETELPKHGVGGEQGAMIDKINKERIEAGAEPLLWDKEIAEIAQIKATDMVENDYFAHLSPTLGSFTEMIKSHGIPISAAAENLAGTTNVDRAHKGLMNSSGHKKNILNPVYTHVGIGIEESPKFGHIYVQIFIKK